MKRSKLGYRFVLLEEVFLIEERDGIRYGSEVVSSKVVRLSNAFESQARSTVESREWGDKYATFRTVQYLSEKDERLKSFMKEQKKSRAGGGIGRRLPHGELNGSPAGARRR